MTTPYYQPFIVAPPFTSCEPAYLVFGQGTPPYSIFVIAPNTSQPLEYLPLQSDPGFFKWTVDFQPGANITFALLDARGESAYSVFRVVQENDGKTCAKNVYTRPKSTNVGAIVGGVLGALAIGVAVLGLFLYHRRKVTSSRKKQQSASYGEPDENDAREVPSGVGVRRAGTFNLHNIRFNEATMDHLREMDTPPTYAAKTTDDPVHAGNEATLAHVPTLSDSSPPAHDAIDMARRAST